MTTALTEKAVLSRTEACRYVGGRPFFEKLLENYPQFLRPLAVGKPTGTKRDGKKAQGKTTYLKDAIDRALKAAHMEQRFVQ